MKTAFAKLMEKNPVQSSHDAFRAGGNGVPILTRASGQSTKGYQTMGNSRSFTTLGAYRMGDQDGNAPASAIYPDDIFNPPGLPDREYPTVTFASTGNNTFQPDDRGKATHALLKRLGDNQFKAKTQAPFEDYVAQQRLARDIQDASRNAGLEDVGKSREILRSLVAERRQQSENDYLRKMINGGATPEFAAKQIEDVRNANALQEARKIDDRSYQAKTLISRMAEKRGIRPAVNEPLSQNSAVMNPQSSQAMASLTGRDGEGFGTSQLDRVRQTITSGRVRSTETKEATDEQTAFSNLLATGEIPLPDSGSYSLATMRGQEQQNEMELQSEALASRLEALRLRQRKTKITLAEPIFAKDLIKKIYSRRGKKANASVLAVPENIQDMTPTQLILSINHSLISHPNGLAKLQKELSTHTWGTGERPSSSWINSLKQVAYKMNNGNFVTDIPSFPTEPFTTKYLLDAINELKNDRSPSLKLAVDSARTTLRGNIETGGNAHEAPKPKETQTEPTPEETASQALPKRTLGKTKTKMTQTQTATTEAGTMTEAKVIKTKAPKAPKPEPTDVYDSLKLPELRTALRGRGLPTSGNRAKLIAKLRSADASA